MLTHACLHNYSLRARRSRSSPLSFISVCPFVFPLLLISLVPPFITFFVHVRPYYYSFFLFHSSRRIAYWTMHYKETLKYLQKSRFPLPASSRTNEVQETTWRHTLSFIIHSFFYLPHSFFCHFFNFSFLRLLFMSSFHPPYVLYSFF